MDMDRIAHGAPDGGRGDDDGWPAGLAQLRSRDTAQDTMQLSTTKLHVPTEADSWRGS